MYNEEKDRPVRRKSYKYAKLKDGRPVSILTSEKSNNFKPLNDFLFIGNLYNECFSDISFKDVYFGASSKIFYDCTFINVKFDNCNIDLCSFYHCKFKSCIFNNTVIYHSKFVYSTFLDCKCTATNTNANECKLFIVNSTFNSVLIDNCKCSKKCYITGTEFYNSDFLKYNFVHIYLSSQLELQLHQCRFSNCNNIPMNLIELSCPSEGSFIGWKYIHSNREYYLIKLLIPEDAKRLSSLTQFNGCRCDKAKVLSIKNMKTGEFEQSVKYIKSVSVKDKDNAKIKFYDVETVYTVGEFVYPDKFDDNREHDCSNGIHFYIDKNTAISTYYGDRLSGKYWAFDPNKFKECIAKIIGINNLYILDEPSQHDISKNE